MFTLFLKVGSIEDQGVVGVTLVDTFYFSSPCRWRRGRYKRRDHVQPPNCHSVSPQGPHWAFSEGSVHLCLLLLRCCLHCHSKDEEIFLSLIDCHSPLLGLLLSINLLSSCTGIGDQFVLPSVVSKPVGAVAIPSPAQVQLSCTTEGNSNPENDPKNLPFIGPALPIAVVPASASMCSGLAKVSLLYIVVFSEGWVLRSHIKKKCKIYIFKKIWTH